MARLHVRTAKSLAITAMTKALEESKYEQNYDKAIELIVALDKAGLKLIKKPLKRIKRDENEFSV